MTAGALFALWSAIIHFTVTNIKIKISKDWLQGKEIALFWIVEELTSSVCCEALVITLLLTFSAALKKVVFQKYKNAVWGMLKG